MVTIKARGEIAVRWLGHSRSGVASKKGLAHAKLCARIAGQLSLANPRASTAETKQALDELIAFRRANEHAGIGNFNHLAWVEDLSWKLSDEMRKAPELYP